MFVWGLALGNACLIAQPAKNAGLGETNAGLGLGFILRALRPCRENADAIVGRHNSDAAVDLGIIETRPVHAGLQIFGAIRRGTLPKKLNMPTCEPIQSGRVWVHVTSE